MRHLILALAAGALLTSCGKGGDYKIAVTFADDSANGKTAYLTNYDSGDTIDSATVSNMSVAFSGKVEDSYFSRLIVDGKRMGFVVEPGNISIIWADKEATGTKLNELLNSSAADIDKIEAEYDALQTKLSDGKMTQAQFDAAAEAVERKESDYFANLYKQNKDNGIGPWAFNNYLMLNGSFGEAQIDSLLAGLPDSYKTLKRVDKAKSDARQKALVAVGRKFIDFAIKTESGKTEKLSDYVGRGQYVVVDFWASWCGPCRRAIKDELLPIYKKYSGKGLTVLGVAVWDAPADTHKAIGEMQIPWKVMIGDKKLTEPTDLYGVSGIPHIMIVDPHGTIVAQGISGQELLTKVDEIMKH